MPNAIIRGKFVVLNNQVTRHNREEFPGAHADHHKPSNKRHAFLTGSGIPVQL